MTIIKEKKVGLFELFSDLIYVYAVSRMTLLIEEPMEGSLPASSIFSYLIVSLVVLQAWLYMTNYVNRYGSWTWYEYLIASVNLGAVVYVSNTISPEWASMQLPFNLAMLVMLLCVAGLYLIQILRKEQDIGAARNSLLIICIVCLIYVASIAAVLSGVTRAVIWLDVLAVLCGAFLPFFIRGRFDIGIISYPHLVESFELLTIITFGEGIVGMTLWFDVHRLSVEPLLVFGTLLTLFGSYVIQIHEMMEHHRLDRGLRLMFSHYGIIIAVNLITVALKLAANPETNYRSLAVLTSVALCLYFISLGANALGNKSEFPVPGNGWILPLALLAVAGTILIALTLQVRWFLAVVMLISLGFFACYLRLLFRSKNMADRGKKR